MPFKSKVEIEDAVYVHIIGHKKVGGHPQRFEVADDGLLQEFLHWLVQHDEIESFRGGSSGLGSYTGWFYAEHKPAIEEFFRSQGVKV